MTDRGDTAFFSKLVESKLKKSQHRITNQDSEYYSHPSYNVKSLSEYIDIISTISLAGDKLSTGDTVIYRGHSDSTYLLTPGLGRLEVREDTEEKLINEFLIRRPDAFSGLSSFDILAKMQHYGLPTRMLDFTTNPLVALYFACESLFEKSGRIICHYTFLQNDSSEYVNSICNAAVKKPFDGNYVVDEYLCNEKLSVKQYLSEIYLNNETMVVRPKYWNKRIANQAGLFMVFPNNLIDKYNSVLTHISEYGLEKAIEEYGRGIRCDNDIIQVISNIEPVDYYASLDTPILTNEYYKRLRNSYQNEQETFINLDIINHRFQMDSSLKPLSREMVSDQFCSIIIEGKFKKKILRDLSYIGIGADYIYPELEYTAKEIKRYYE